LDFNSYWDSSTIFSLKLRNSSTKLISSDGNIKLFKDWGEINVLSGLISSIEETVDGVVSKEELEVFASLVSVRD